MNRLSIAALLTAALAASAFAGGALEEARYAPADRIVAIGDVHGDLEATRRALRLAGAIDEVDRWVGGDLVVVQTGDQLDRGDDEREILELLDRLEKEARSSGGALLTLNGNHELMNVAQDFRYVTDGGWEDFAEFATASSEDGVADADGSSGRAAAFGPGGHYARLLAQRDVVVVVGDNVFCHGGIRAEHLNYGLDRLNRETRAWLAGEGPEPEWFRAKDNPVWTRRYSDEPTADACTELGEVLERLGASRMIVGHTVQSEGITAHCDERVWCIDVGMAAAYGGEPQVLEIVGDVVRILEEVADPVAPE